MNLAKHTPKTLQKKLIRAFFFLALGLTAITAYQNSLGGEFAFDDYGNIVGNESLYLSSLEIDNILNIFSPYQPSSNRKIPNLTFALNYYVGQLNPVGFHFVNILIHIINGCLIFVLFQWYLGRSNISRTWNPVILSGIGALIWLSNPTQIYAVTYIVQRMTSLSTMFSLISIMLYLTARGSDSKQPTNNTRIKKIIFFTLSFITFVLALLSKEIAAILPILILVHEIYFFNLVDTLKRRKNFLYFLIVLIFSVLVIQIFIITGKNFLNIIMEGYNQRDFTLMERLLTESRVVFYYMQLFLVPIPTKLHLYHDTYQISDSILHPMTTLSAVTGVVIWIALIYYFFNKKPLISFALLWVFLCLIIESTIIPLELIFIHRFYMPSIGFTLLLSLIPPYLCQHFNLQLRPAFFYLFFSIVIITQIMGTSTANRPWNNSIDFALQEVKHNPSSSRALGNLGWILLEKGLASEAKPYLQKAIEQDPDSIVNLNNLLCATTNTVPTNFEQIESYIQKILTLVKKEKNIPQDSQALVNLAHYLYKRERYKESLLLLKAIRLPTKLPILLLYTGQCYLKLQQNKEAAITFQEAYKLSPKDFEIAYYYALSLYRNNQKDKAQEILQKTEIKDRASIELKNKWKILRQQIL